MWMNRVDSSQQSACTRVAEGSLKCACVLLGRGKPHSSFMCVYIWSLPLCIATHGKKGALAQLDEL